MRFLLLLLASMPAFAAISGTAQFSIRSGGSNANGALFDPGATFTLTDGVGASMTGATPTLSSGTYCFVAGDVGHKLYTVSNTDGEVVRGRWPITAVNSCVATLNAAAGAATYHVGGGRVHQVSLTNGMASTAAPTNITFGVDYSESTSPKCDMTDLAIDATTNTDVTSASCVFGPNHIGNGIKVASGTGFTVQLVYIQSIQSGNKARLDNSAGTTSSTGGVGKLGGSFSLGSSDDAIFEYGKPGNEFWVENASYTLGGTVSIGANGGNQTPIRIYGYNSVRGDDPTGASRPTFNAGAASFTLGQYWQIYNMQFTGTANGVVVASVNTMVYRSKVTNTSTTADLYGLNLGSTGASCKSCELVSYRGRAVILSGAGGELEDSVIHDSKICVASSGSNVTNIRNNLIYGCTAQNIWLSAANTATFMIANNTIHGHSHKLGNGIEITTGSTNVRLKNNIIDGFDICVKHADANQFGGLDENNLLYNCNTFVDGWVLSKSSRTDVDPGYVSVTQFSETGASSTTNVITAASGSPFSGVVDNVDYAMVTAGTGTGIVLPSKFLITAHSGNTITLSNSVTTSGSGSGITVYVTQGHNYAIGTGPKGLGLPGLFPRGLTQGYTDVGAVQRQETSGGGQRIQ